jgi:hypothetical protein
MQIRHPKTQNELGNALRAASPAFRAQVYNDYLVSRKLELQQKEQVWLCCDNVTDCIETTD